MSLPLLNKAITLAILQISGKDSLMNISLKQTTMSFIMTGAQSLTIILLNQILLNLYQDQSNVCFLNS